MSFIPKQDKTPKARVTVHLRQDTADMANQYAAYLDSDLDHVIEQLLLKAFRSDKEFQKTRLSTSTRPLRTAERRAKSHARSNNKRARPTCQRGAERDRKSGQPGHK